MANSKKCERCGANLDFGEKCTCADVTTANQGSKNNRYYRAFPEFDRQQALDALHQIKMILQ